MHQTLDQDRLYVTVDLLILSVQASGLQLLLSRRKTQPYQGRWALPGRFVGLNESAETAARNLMAEMLPIRGAYLEQLYTFTEVNRDPRGRVISTAYLVIVPPRQIGKALEEGPGILHPFLADTASGIMKLTGGGITLVKDDLAFDHGRIIETGLARLEGKIDYTDIGFRFLNDPDAFSLGDLQAVFEAVLEHPLDSSNFRRFIRKRYEETGRLKPIEKEEKQKRGRPAALYRWVR